MKLLVVVLVLLTVATGAVMWSATSGPSPVSACDHRDC
jgi:hypothetical protein